LCGPEAAAPLAERLAKDPAMAVRAEALVHLLQLQAATPEQLLEALKVDDEKVQCLAARGLVRCGQGHQAIRTLRMLADSKDRTTSVMARVGLLAAGDGGQESVLREVFRDPETTDEILSFALEQMATENVAAAVELVGQVAWSDRREAVRVRAFKTLSILSPKSAATIVGAIEKSDSTIFRVYLLESLASQADSVEAVRKLSARSDAIGTLARFELARPAGGPAAAEAVRAVFAMGHPVMLDYVIDRARKDVDARGKDAGFYVPALLEFIRSVEPNPAQMGASHYRAAQAATLLLDLGTADASAGLRDILAGPYDAVKRSVGAGLMRTKNRSACDLARPLLDNPYQEMVVDAALTLGRFGDPSAVKTLRDIVAEPSRHETELVVLAAWYLLKIEGRSAEAARALAAKVR